MGHLITRKDWNENILQNSHKLELCKHIKMVGIHENSEYSSVFYSLVLSLTQQIPLLKKKVPKLLNPYKPSPIPKPQRKHKQK